MRRPIGVIAASPTMVGAITVLVAIVAVFLAYNANRGLPFVPTYQITAQVENAKALVPSNEVRIGGLRVGLVDEITPVEHEDGSTTARLELTLDDEVEPLPKDSTVVIRARSALGLKYLEINRGSSSQGWAPGSVVPLNRARPEPVELDQILNTFDQPTRLGVRRNLTEFGGALAGRGVDLNLTLGRLSPLLGHLRSVMRNLGSPAARLDRTFVALEATVAEVAPVAELQAEAFTFLDITFSALARVARPFIQETISRAPATLDALTAQSPRIRPFLRHGRALVGDLAPGARSLAGSAPAIADAITVGIPALNEAPQLNRRLPPTAAALKRFNDDPDVQQGVSRLTATSELLSPTLRFVAPAQSVCDYATLLLRNGATASATGDGGGLGTYQRFIVFDPPTGPNNEGSPSSAPANGGGSDVRNYLHANPYPNTASPGQPRECEAGREPYLIGEQVIGNVPGNQGTP